MRLSRLEHKLLDTSWPPVRLTVPKLDPERRENLVAGERIVTDWYQCIEPELGFIYSRERITTDPLDLGRICQPGQCLEDVMQEIGRKCEREQDGICRTCGPGQYPDRVLRDPEFQARLVAVSDKAGAQKAELTSVQPIAEVDEVELGSLQRIADARAGHATFVKEREEANRSKPRR